MSATVLARAAHVASAAAPRPLDAHRARASTSGCGSASFHGRLASSRSFARRARASPRVAAVSAAASSADEESQHPYYSADAAGPADVDTLLRLYLTKAKLRSSAEEVVSADDPDARVGRVYLVGTGPGDPGLLTLKAFHLMQTADVVMYDRLVAPAILDLVHESAQMVYVGKQSGFHTRTQDEIEAMLLGFAANGATVVRLKGGDPLVFGRGGEEMETLMARGHEVRIVPGVTAAAGVGSELGIPLTHRGAATSVRLLTGHLRETAAREAEEGKGNGVVDPVDFAVTSADVDTTLVVYMGLATLPSLSAKLVASGFPRDTPAVAVERGTTPGERRVFSTIEHLPDAVVEETLRSPTLIIVGSTVRLSPWWPWRDARGAVASPAEREAKYVAQRGSPTEDAAEWFERESTTVRKLRALGRGDAGERGERGERRSVAR